MRALIAETDPVTERLRVREIDDDEGQRLVRIIRRGSGSVVTSRRAQMVLLSAQGMDAPAIAKVTFTSEDRVRDVIRNFNADGFSSLYPKYKGGRPPKFTSVSGGRSRSSPSPGRPSKTCRFPPGAWPSWPISWWPRGWSTTSATRAAGPGPRLLRPASVRVAGRRPRRPRA
jgi:Winged helix-turn helix